MRLLVIFHRLGPYHHARLKAANRVAPIVALELSGKDRTYAWETVAGATEFERYTVFEAADCETVPTRAVVEAVTSHLETIAPDVVAIPGVYDRGALAALGWCRRNAVPCVLMSESTERDFDRHFWKEWMKRQLLKSVSTAFVGGRPQRDYVLKLGVAADRIFTGYDAVDNEYFASRADKVRARAAHYRRTHSLPEHYFFSSNRFAPKKNLPRLVEAFAAYREQATEPWDLVLLGDGDVMPDVREQVSRLTLREHVLLPGFRQYEEIPAYYALADCYVQASTSEQWGLVVNEAMASGLPVLVSRMCGCVEDLVCEGDNGFTFDPYEVAELAEKMLMISSGQCALQQMASRSREIISHWGSDNFGVNLWRAAEAARECTDERGVLAGVLLKTMLSCR